DHGIKAVIRGLRAASDFEYEGMMASMNKRINPDVETLFMMTSPNLYFVSSTMIKELYLYGGDITPYVPAEVVRRLKNKMGKQPGPTANRACPPESARSRRARRCGSTRSSRRCATRAWTW